MKKKEKIMMRNPISLLTTENIKNMFHHVTYRRGLSYFVEKRVLEVDHIDGYIWRAKVSGSEVYDVSVELKNDSVESKCNCLAFDRFHECKHQVAVLLEILHINKTEQTSKSVNRNEIQKNYKETNRLIEALTQQNYNRKETYQDELMVEYTLTAHSLSHKKYYLTIKMKTGINRLYVVKTIKDFLESVEKGEDYFFTSKFSFDPNEHRFGEEDLEIIEILLSMIRNENIYRSSSPYYYSNQYLDDRELIIPPTIAKEFLDKLKDRNVLLEHGNNEYKGYEIREGSKLPFTYRLNQGTEGTYLLQFDQLQSSLLFESYGYLYYQQVFYSLTNEQKGILKEIFPLLNSQQQLSFQVSDRQIHRIISEITPVLKKIGDIQVEEKISDKIVTYPLQAKMYIDYSSYLLQVKLEYHYGDSVINPFDTSNQGNSIDRIIMREIEKEQEIMGTIENTSLKFNGKELYMEEEEEIYHFLYHVLPTLDDKIELYMTDSAKSLVWSDLYKPSVSLDIDSTGNWLDIGFDMEGIDHEEIQNILGSVIERKRYYRLADGTFVSLEDEEFESIGRLIKGLNISREDLDSDTIKRSVYKGIQVDGILGDEAKQHLKIGKSFRRLIHNIKNPDQLDFNLPAALQATLRDYQVFGFQWMKTLSHYHFGGILADDMGLGKTIQAIAFIASEKEEKKAGPVMIVAPSSLIYNWKNECNKFIPSLDVRVVYGTPEERKELIKDLNQADVWITSYPLIRQDIDLYKDFTFSTLFLDEAQAIKNSTTKTFKEVRHIEANHKFALSGTPIENKIEELWSIFQVILPGFFPNKVDFSKLSHDNIAKMVRPFILRRVKRDVLKELPDKIETVNISELTKDQKELYVGYLEKIQNETKESIAIEGFNKSRIKILAGLTRLRQICNHPSLFIENYQGESGKLEQLMELVDSAISNGNRLLIFSQFASMLRMIHHTLQDEGYSCFYLDGQTPSKERVEMAEHFNQGEKEIFLISLKAGGTGLNLTGADTVILFDLWWNPAVEEQATGRAHRIGQKNVVQVIRLITKGTIEEKIFELQQKKRELIDKVIQPGEEMLTSLSEDEIKEILSIS